MFAKVPPPIVSPKRPSSGFFSTISRMFSSEKETAEEDSKDVGERVDDFVVRRRSTRESQIFFNTDVRLILMVLWHFYTDVRSILMVLLAHFKGAVGEQTQAKSVSSMADTRVQEKEGETESANDHER